MAPYQDQEKETVQPRGLTLMWNGILLWMQYRPRTALGIIIGILAGLLYHWLGLLHMLVLILCVAIGYIIGKYLDDRKEVGQVLDRLFTSDQ